MAQKRSVQWDGEIRSIQRVENFFSGIDRVKFCVNCENGLEVWIAGYIAVRAEPGQWLVRDREIIEVLDHDPLADPRQVIADWLDKHDDGGRACKGLRAVLEAAEPVDGDDAYEFGYASAMNDVVEAVREALSGEGE